MVTVHRELRLAAFLGLHPTPANVEGMGLFGQGGGFRGFGIEGRVGFEAPGRMGVGKEKGVAHGQDTSAQFLREVTIGVCQATVHFLLRFRFAGFAGGFRETRVVDPVGPGLVDEQLCSRGMLRDVGGEPVGEGLISGRIVAFDAGLLDRDVVPLLREEFILEAASIRVEPGFVLRIGFVLLRFCGMQLERGATHDDGTMNQGVPAGCGEVVEVIRGVAREAVSDREEADGFAGGGRGGQDQGEADEKGADHIGIHGETCEA